MDCKEFSNLLDAFMEDALPDAEARAMRAHAAECASCAALLSVRGDCRRLDEEIEVPDSFSSSWRRMIREETKMEEKPKNTAKWKTWAAVAAALVFVIGGTLMTRDDMLPRTVRKETANYTLASGEAGGGALSASKNRTADTAAPNVYYLASEVPAEPMMDAGAYDYYAEEAEMGADTAGTESGQAEKIIRNASFTVKTTRYEEDLQQLQDLAAQVGGRVEYLSSYGDASSGQTRSASLTLRIPAGRLDDFLNGAQGIGAVTAMTQEMEDVSSSYYDIQNRLKTQQEKLARLQKLMASAEDVSDLIEIESAIADTQYYIDRYTGQLKSYDSRVDYSTVQVSVRETKAVELKEVTLGERILSGLQGSLENGLYFLEDMTVFLIAALPWLAVLGIIVFVVRKIIKKKKNRKE